MGSSSSFALGDRAPRQGASHWVVIQRLAYEVASSIAHTLHENQVLCLGHPTRHQEETNGTWQARWVTQVTPGCPAEIPALTRGSRSGRGVALSGARAPCRSRDLMRSNIRRPRTPVDRRISARQLERARPDLAARLPGGKPGGSCQRPIRPAAAAAPASAIGASGGNSRACQMSRADSPYQTAT